MSKENPFKEWRKAKRIGPHTAGVAVGVRRETWWRWETGASKVALDKLARVELVTGIPREKLRPDLYGNLEAAQ